MGTVRNGRRERGEKEGSFGANQGAATPANDGVASACHSPRVVEGSEAGATGTCGRIGVTQQEGVAQLAGSKLQHLHAGAEGTAAFRGGTTENGCATAAIPSTPASNSAMVLRSISVIRNIPNDPTA